MRSAHDRLLTEARASSDFGNFIDLDAAKEGNHVMNIPQACQRDIAFQRASSITPVSYTHLTLPTILRV